MGKNWLPCQKTLGQHGAVVGICFDLADERVEGSARQQEEACAGIHHRLPKVLRVQAYLRAAYSDARERDLVIAMGGIERREDGCG